MSDFDEILTLDEAAALMKVGARWLESSDVPRSPLGAGGKRGRVLFLRSQCVAYVAARLTTQLCAVPGVTPLPGAPTPVTPIRKAS